MALKKSIKGVWGISEVGFSIMATMETSFLVFFLTDVALLPLGITAVITGFTALADAISAILAGIVISKVKFKGGKYRQWLLVCPPFVTLFFVLCFTRIGGDVVAGSIIGIGYVLSHFIWNIAWTANRTLIPIISNDPDDKSFLSARIALGANLGKIASSLLVPALSTFFLATFGGVNAYTLTALIVCLIFWVCYYIHYFITKGHDSVETGAKPATFSDMAKAVAVNPPLISFLLHDAFRLVAFYGTAATSIYYCKVVLGAPAKVATMLIFFYLGSALGTLLTKWVVNKLGNKKTTVVCMLGWLVFHASCLLLPDNFALIGAALLVAQFSFGIAYGQTSNYYGMCGAYSEWKTGKDTRGVVMAFCSLAIKIAIALRGVIITAALGIIAYDATLKVFSPEMMTGIKMVYILVPCIFIVLSFIPLAFFKLSDEKVAEIESEIAARKQAA